MNQGRTVFAELVELLPGGYTAPLKTNALSRRTIVYCIVYIGDYMLKEVRKVRADTGGY
ncbi:MAG: hypothetical protein ACP5VQ_00050 [Phycisphaerae bacterium]